MTRPTRDELILSDAARAMDRMRSGEFPAQGCLRHQERGDAKTDVHPIPAYTLNESDQAYYRNTPMVTPIGGYATCPMWVQNTVKIVAPILIVGFLAVIFYVLTFDWSDFLAGLKNLSSW